MWSPCTDGCSGGKAGSRHGHGLSMAAASRDVDDDVTQAAEPLVRRLGCSTALRAVVRERAERSERFDGRGEVGVGGEAVEVGVVAQDRRAVVFCDGGDQVVEAGTPRCW